MCTVRISLTIQNTVVNGWRDIWASADDQFEPTIMIVRPVLVQITRDMKNTSPAPIGSILTVPYYI
jgi:hypothetical protein